ncbi:MAG: Inosine/uridine-preferring nucleoside hydrolase [Gemmatimonadetes bacterium]|nr:Inosine/uridine-preferring nucleoside hydrolase [Gemmatimonadota bacterium]
MHPSLAHPSHRLHRTVAIASVLALATVGCRGSDAAPAREVASERVETAASGRRERLFFSSDVAAGLQGGWRGGISDPDDGWAIAMAMADSTLDVRGVAVTLGNNLMEPERTVADSIAGMMARRTGRPRVHVSRGAAVKLPNPDVRWTTTGAAFPAACRNEGVDSLAAELRRGPLTVIAIGPLTDVACLVLNHPAEAARIRRVVAIMGRTPGQSFAIGGRAGLTDFNLVMDDSAMSVVLHHSAVPLVFMTFGLTSSALVNGASVDSLAAAGGPAGFLVPATKPWIAWWSGYFHEPGFHPWDQNAVYYLQHPEAFSCARVPAEIVPCPADPDHDQAGRCASHGPGQPASLNKEAVQLWLGPGGMGRPVTACTAYAGPAAKQAFTRAAIDFLR